MTTTEDTCYYLLNVWKMLGYDQERDELHLTGDLSQQASLMGELKKYIRKIFIINPQAELHSATDTPIEEVPFDIQSLLICE